MQRIVAFQQAEVIVDAAGVSAMLNAVARRRNALRIVGITAADDQVMVVYESGTPPTAPPVYRLVPVDGGGTAAAVAAAIRMRYDAGFKVLGGYAVADGHWLLVAKE